MPSKLNEMITKELVERFPAGTDYLVISYDKLTSNENMELRRTLRQSKIVMEAVKNSLATRALTQVGRAGGAKFLSGPCALIIGEKEMPAICKIMREIVAKYEKKIAIRGGLMGDVVLSADMVGKLADIPPMPVLQAKIAGSVQAPITALAGAFQSIARSMACALEAIRQQKESSVPPSSPATAASEPAPAAG